MLSVSSQVTEVGTPAWMVTSLVPESVHGAIVARHRNRSLLALAAALGLSIITGALVARYMQRAQRIAELAHLEARAAEARAVQAEGVAKKLGSYELVRCLGKGGMGEVWRASRRLQPKDAAIKLIRTDQVPHGQPGELQMRFRREARSLAQLRSRNTVNIFDYGVAADGSLFW
jgi:hypothetical protein